MPLCHFCYFTSMLSVWCVHRPTLYFVTFLRAENCVNTLCALTVPYTYITILSALVFNLGALVKFLPKSNPKSSQIQWHTRLLILRMAVSQKKKATVNQIPNAAVVLVVSFALLANLSILSKWHLRQFFFFFSHSRDVLSATTEQIFCSWNMTSQHQGNILPACHLLHFSIYEFNHYTVRVRYFS